MVRRFLKFSLWVSEEPKLTDSIQVAQKSPRRWQWVWYLNVAGKEQLYTLVVQRR